MKNRLIKILMTCMVIMSLTGCYTKDNIIESGIVSMNFGAKVSSVIDAKVESSSYSGNLVEIVYDNGVTFKNIYGNALQTCSFEGPKEIIDTKIRDYTKICFSYLNPQQLQKVIDSLINTGCYEETINDYLYSAKYQENCIVYEVRR